MPGGNVFTSFQRPRTRRSAPAAAAPLPADDVPAKAQTLRAEEAPAQPIPVLLIALGKLTRDQRRPFQSSPNGNPFSASPLTRTVPRAQMLCLDGATSASKNADVLATARHWRDVGAIDGSLALAEARSVTGASPAKAAAMIARRCVSRRRCRGAWPP